MNNNSLKSEDKEYNFWIHRIDFDKIDELHEGRILGAQKERATIIRDIHKNDRILLVTKRSNIEFFGYTMVDETYADKESLYDGYYNSKKKLKLKGIKYFSKPISTKDIADKLDFIEKKDKSANYFKAEYKKISKKDFAAVWKRADLIKEYPEYLDVINMSLKDFILKTINNLYHLLKKFENRKQIEIKKFIILLRKILSEYGIAKSFDDLQDFYSKNVHELGFKHVPSRDPDKFVPLYTPLGDKRNFAYISLE